jgi:hypothetical protein
MKWALAVLLLLAGVFAGVFFVLREDPGKTSEALAPPQPQPDELADPQTLVDLLQASGKEPGKVVIPPGTYRFADGPSRGVVIQGMRNSRIEAEGVTLVFKPGQSFTLKDCENVEVSGLTVDYDPLPFTQGTITAINPAEDALTMTVEEGYPAPPAEGTGKPGPTLFFIYDPETSEPRPLQTESVRQISHQGGGQYRLSGFTNGFLMESVGQPGGARVGDRITLKRRAGSAVVIENCARIKLAGVTVFTSPGYAFFEVGGEGANHYDKCRIIRKPGTTRLLTTAADGFHSYQTRRGPLIENCEFADTVDDTIAIHGFFSLVMESPSPRTLHAVSPFGRDFSPGATLSFYAIPHGAPLGEAVVTSVEDLPASDLAVPVEEFRRKYHDRGLKMRGLPVTQALKIVLDRDISLPAGRLVLASSDEQCGNGAIIRNNTLRRGHVRGVIVKANDVLIEGNRFDWFGANAVLVYPELFFLEGPVPRGITIRGNTISRSGWKVLSPRFAVPGIGGAIQTCTSMARRLFPPQLDPYPVIRDILIEDNTITDSGSYGIVLGNVESGRVTGNRIDFPFNKPGARESEGLARAFDSEEHNLKVPDDVRARPAGILVYGSRDVTLSANQVTPSVAESGVEPVLIGPWSENIEKLD